MKKRITSIFLILIVLMSTCGCVDQHPEKNSESNGTYRLVATSPATMDICDKLGLSLVGIPATEDIPERFSDTKQIGTAMAPDVEQIALLQPTDVIGPASLQKDLEPKYQATGIPYTFIDLKSVEGMYESIALLGNKYGVQNTARQLINDYKNTLSQFQNTIQTKERPTVLILMGLPGSYIEATKYSYVGSLVELCNAENVVSVEEEDDFVSWNTEELLQLDPDYILLTAHGLPDEAMKMFSEEFKNNDIWSHFRAVQQGRVYELNYDLFGMSATFMWPQALMQLKQILYDGSQEPFVRREGNSGDD